MTDYGRASSRPTTPDTAPYAPDDTPWWVSGWLDLLASYRFKKRLERARDYARQGNVLSIDFKGAKVVARVQGTERDPYRVTLSLDPFDNEAWTAVAETLASQAVWAAQLLAGEMPATIDRAFAQSGLSLFPFTLSDVHSHCSCPDQANPCKHIGAVYYLLADRFADDPFVLFQLRGRSQAQLLEDLRSARSSLLSQVAGSGESGEATGTQDPTLVPIAPEDVARLGQIMAQATAQATALEVDRFWFYGEMLESSLVAIVPPPDAETPLDWLGPIALPSDGSANPAMARSANKAALEYLKDIYRTASQQAIVEALS